MMILLVLIIVATNADNLADLDDGVTYSALDKKFDDMVQFVVV